MILLDPISMMFKVKYLDQPSGSTFSPPLDEAEHEELSGPEEPEEEAHASRPQELLEVRLVSLEDDEDSEATKISHNTCLYFNLA